MSISSGLQLWRSQPLFWAIVCVFVAVAATSLALTVWRDPQVAIRRSYLRQCHEQAYDRGVADRCEALAQARYPASDIGGQRLAYGVAAVAVTFGTLFVLLYVIRQVGGAVGQRR